jgi:acetolactate synthase-1/2/3 large subunit
VARREYSGGELICGALERLGVRHVFGVPGTQNVDLFEALRRSKMRTVLATSELAAGFMANGYFRASGVPGTFATISGPGFAYALPPLAEARQDSAAVLHLVNAPPEGTHKFLLQALEQRNIIASVAKCVVDITTPDEVPASIARAYQCSLEEEPGPVTVQFSRKALQGTLGQDQAERLLSDVKLRRVAKEPEPGQINQFAAMLASAKRPVFYVGQGSLSAARELQMLAEGLNAPVITTRSARGVLPMDHPLSLAFDFNGTGATGVNELFQASDLVIVLGSKLGHNGTSGFRIQFPTGRMVQVDTSREVLAGNYPARLAIHADVRNVLVALAAHTEFPTLRVAKDGALQPSRGWTTEELARWKPANQREWGEGPVEPSFPTAPGGSAKGFFDALRAVLPRDAILVTDSGLHQVMAFRHWQSLAPRGIIAPSDFQSMGFGLPAAIGATFADPGRKVMALIGDGGMAMSGMEMLTAVREELDLTVIVFNDGALGQIQLQQFGAFGASHATTLRNPDFGQLADALGASYFPFEEDAESTLRKTLETPGVKLVEIPVGRSRAMTVARVKGKLRRNANNLMGRGKWAQWKARLKGK